MSIWKKKKKAVPDFHNSSYTLYLFSRLFFNHPEYLFSQNRVKVLSGKYRVQDYANQARILSSILIRIPSSGF
jgi:hypothetical protein